MRSLTKPDDATDANRRSRLRRAQSGRPRPPRRMRRSRSETRPLSASTTRAISRRAAASPFFRNSREGAVADWATPSSCMSSCFEESKSDTSHAAGGTPIAPPFGQSRDRSSVRWEIAKGCVNVSLFAASCRLSRTSSPRLSSGGISRAFGPATDEKARAVAGIGPSLRGGSRGLNMRLH